MCGGVCVRRYGYGSDKSGWSGRRLECDDVALARSIGPTVPGKSPAGARAAGPLGKTFAKYPTLEQWLSETAWDDGTARTPGSFLVFAQDGKWKAMITDKDGDQIAFVTADDFEGLLGALEKGLTGRSLDWRPPRGGTGRKGK